MPLDLRTAHMC